MNRIHQEISTRIDYIDLAKGLCILAVLWYHVLYCRLETPLDFALVSFRMPLYYFLSGLFFKIYKGMGDFARRKTNKLLIPFLFFYLLSYAAGVICDLLGFYEKGLVQDPFRWTQLFDIFVTEDLTYNAPLWFFISLFEVNLLFYGLIRLTREKTIPLILGTVGIGAAGFLLMREQINIPYYLDTSMRALPFFAVGYFIRKYTNLLNPGRKDRILAFVLPALAFVVYKYAPRVPDNPFSYYGVALAGITFIIGLAKLIGYVPIISYIGRYSLVVLGTNMFLTAPCRLVVGSWGVEGTTCDVLTSLASILVS